MGEVYANTMNGVQEKNDWKAFVERWRIAEKAERELARRDPMRPELAIELSLEMLNLYESLHGNPFVKDPITLREEEEVRQAWKRLRERWRRAG
jgi:hypothetical protein